MIPDPPSIHINEICDTLPIDSCEVFLDKPGTLLSASPTKQDPEFTEPQLLLHNNTVYAAEVSECCPHQQEKLSQECVTSHPVFIIPFYSSRKSFLLNTILTPQFQGFKQRAAKSFILISQIKDLFKLQVVQKLEMHQDRLKRLLTYYEVLAEKIRVEDLLPKLFSYHNYTKEERQRIEKEGQRKGTLAQTQLLLDILKTKDDRAYDLFINSLESTGHTELAQYLQHELSPSAVLSAADKQKIQSHFAVLVERMRISPVMAILRDEPNYFTVHELAKLDDILNERKKTDCLLTEVILKGTYRHLALLKKTLTEVEQPELAKLLPVDLTIIGLGDVPLSGEPVPIELEVRISSSRPFSDLRGILVSRICDANHDLRKRLVMNYRLSSVKSALALYMWKCPNKCRDFGRKEFLKRRAHIHVTGDASHMKKLDTLGITAEVDPSNDHTFILTMMPHRAPMLNRIEDDVKSDHLAKILKQYSFVPDTPSWKLMVRKRSAQGSRSQERREGAGDEQEVSSTRREFEQRQGASPDVAGWRTESDNLTEEELTKLTTELPTFIDHLVVDQVVNQLYTAGVLTSDQRAQIESLGTNQLKAAFLYEDVLMKGGSYRNVDVLRQVLQAVDKEGLAMLLPKRDVVSGNEPFRFEGEPPPRLTGGQEKKQQLGPSQLPIAKSVIFSMLAGKDHTPYDLWTTLKKYKGTVYDTYAQLKNEEGLNLLHMCVDKGRLSLLITLVQMGWWTALSKEKVPDTSLSEHKGRIGRQIAESKRTRKPLDEVNQFTEWENSLSSVMKAARQGDVAKVKQQLRIEGAESHYRDSNNGNALYWAVVSGSMEVLKILIDFGMDYSMKTKKGETLLHIACMLGHHHMVDVLVRECNIDVTIEDQNHKTAFDRCAENGDIDTLIALLKCGLTPPNSYPVLTSFAGRKPCLEYCLEQLKMNIDCKDMYERTPLHRSVEGGKYDIAKYLIDRGADLTPVTCSLRNMLHIVAESGSLSIFNLLIEELEKKNLLEKMLNEQDRYNGVDLCFLIRGRDRGRDAWHYVEVQRYKAPIFLKKTKAGNVDVAAYGTVIKSGWGVNPEQDVIDYIEDMFKGRRLNRSAPLDQTPLQIAIFKGHVEIANLLLQKGAKVNIKDKFGLTPLMVAAAKGFLDIIKELERKGASFKIVNLDGKTASDIADENENEEILHYIMGRDYYQMCTNFVSGDLERLRDELSADRLDEVRAAGNDVRRHLINTLRDFRIDINQFLLDLGSGPVLEAVDT